MKSKRYHHELQWIQDFIGCKDGKAEKKTLVNEKCIVLYVNQIILNSWKQHI